jgi:protein TonB
VLAADDKDEVGESLRFSLAGDIVELLVYTTDDAFMQTLREAVGTARRLWHVPSADQVSDLLVAGQVGILVLDVQSQPDAAAAFVAHIKRQFPDLVILVAGTRDTEASLARLISDGSIHRFLHKPVSPERAKLFVEAAVKKHREQQRRRLPPAAARSAPGRRRVWAAGAVLGAALAAALLAAAALRHGTLLGTPPPAPAQPPVPGKGGAAPAATPATGPAEQRERLLAQAESALLEERLEDAAGAIDAARQAGVESGRISFLASQLARLRDRLKPPAGTARPRPDLHAAPEQPAAPEAPAGQDLAQVLTLAAQRQRDGQLLEPERDSARFYVEQALRIDPDGDATQAARETLARDLLSATRAAIEQRDFARASRLLDGAEGIAVPSNLDHVHQLLAAALEADHKAGQQPQPAQDSARPDQPAAAGHPPGADTGAAVRDLSAAAEAQQQQPIDARQLALVKSVQPTYPAAAARTHTEGWVELDFTVAESGQVEQVAVHAAHPAGVFDAAAIGALSQWRYQPLLRDSKPVAQRVRIRIRFTLAG